MESEKVVNISVRKKLCKDCVYVVPGRSNDCSDAWMFAKCGRSERAADTDPVTGDKVSARPHYCSTERIGFLPTCCGPDGKHFERRPFPYPFPRSLTKRFPNASTFIFFFSAMVVALIITGYFSGGR